MKIKKLFSLPLACMMCTSFFVSAAAEINTGDPFYNSFLSEMKQSHGYRPVTDSSEWESGHVADIVATYDLGGLAFVCDDIAQLQSGKIGSYTVELYDHSIWSSSLHPGDVCQLLTVDEFFEEFRESLNGVDGTENMTITLADDFGEIEDTVYLVRLTYEHREDYAQILDALLADSTVTMLGSVYAAGISPGIWGEWTEKAIVVKCASDLAVQQLQREYDIKYHYEGEWVFDVSRDMTAVEAMELCKQLTQREGVLEARPNVAVPVSTDSVSGCGVALERFYTDLPGDLNADCVADITDAVLLARVVAEDDAVPVYGKSLNNADVDGDGLLTIMDVTALLDHIANIPAES